MPQVRRTHEGADSRCGYGGRARTLWLTPNHSLRIVHLRPVSDVPGVSNTLDQMWELLMMGQRSPGYVMAAMVSAIGEGTLSAHVEHYQVRRASRRWC